MYIKLLDQPISVHQNNFTPSKGNALQACIASIFGKSLDEVPNFITLDCGYEQGIREYVKEYYMVEKKSFDLMNNNIGDKSGKICILRGQSPRGDFGHVVVARIMCNREVKMIHDPHPDNTFLDESVPFGWYMTFKQIC